MALTKASVPARLADTLVIDTDADTNTGADNVFSGSATVYYFQIENTTNSSDMYLKVDDATGASLNPEYVFYAPGNKTISYIIHNGEAFSSGVSFVATTTLANGSAMTNPDPAPTVKILGN